MKIVQIAVGSKRKPKLGAVAAALESCGSLLDADARFELIGVGVESGVSHTPSSCQELMLGARQRAEELVRIGRERGASWRYFVGLEGGLDVFTQHQDEPAQVFLESCAYVSDGTHGYFGRSGGVKVPDALAREVLERGVELSVAIDRFAGAVGIRDGQGAWGVLTRDLIGRQEAFRVALVAAFAPFYNPAMYSTARAAGNAGGSGESR